MRQARWVIQRGGSYNGPQFYHCTSRIVDRSKVFGDQEKEMFSKLMRKYEKFSGCRILSYCLMDDHFHLLLEVPNQAVEDIPDEDLLMRVSALHGQDYASELRKQLSSLDAGRSNEDSELQRQLLRKSYTYRMHNLSQFMKGLLQSYTQWHNREHGRRGTLWENRFKSVIVEPGPASRALSAYIDLNPVRSNLVTQPHQYKWSSYGEVHCNIEEKSKLAAAGLARAYGANLGMDWSLGKWKGKISRAYRKLLVHCLASNNITRLIPLSDIATGKHSLDDLEPIDAELPFASMLKNRIRYFTDGAVIGSRNFVDRMFLDARTRFGSKRINGARKLRGNAALAAGIIWSFRDLRT